MATPTSCIPERPDPQEMWDKVAAQFSSMVLGGGDIVPESNEWYVTSLLVAMQEQFYAYASQISIETDPRTACCDNLVSIAADWGMYPLPAQFAEGYALLTGDPLSPLSDPMEMTAAGQTFRSVGIPPTALNEEGAAIVRFQALDAGPAGNIAGTQTGTLASPPEGVDARVKILGGAFCGGADEEACEAFRQRFLARLGFRPNVTQAWVIEKLLEWPCVTRACARAGNCCDPDADECCPDNCSENTGNEFYVFMDNTFACGIPPQCVVDEIEAWMFGTPKGRGLGRAPIGVCGGLVVPRVANFRVQIDAVQCLTPSQQEAIRTAISGFMLQACPSVDITYQQFTVIIGQVLGALAQFDVAFIPAAGAEGITVTNCGLTVDCDVMPCVSSIAFVSPIDVGPCSDV